MQRTRTTRWIWLPIIPLVLAGVVAWVGIESYQQNSRIHIFIEPEAKSLEEAIRAAELIVVGRSVMVGETLLESTEDGWTRPVTEPSRHTTPYTDFQIEIMDVVYAAPGVYSGEEAILLRTVGGASVIVEPDVDHREDLLRANGQPHVFFLSRSLSPYDPGTWRAIDSVHIFPFREGKIHPNTRSLRWNVDTIKSPITVEELKARVRKVGMDITPAPGDQGSPGFDSSER